ncbi:hypothetical protein IWX87_003166 [Polaromonas sp. CG_9.7]|nr:MULTISPECIES: hypothetical protein [unclassified Polaromonas]MBG6073393.1 hypothetical protein [Polaromonas sp. CG_9.7]MBG6115422.1 hypothetical protein [Polaromonas sp. CG_9.2]MDH6186113.1 hypothetical protein [Polaromonas sp. CG_23.6]
MLIFSGHEIEGRSAMPADKQLFTAGSDPLAQALRKLAPQTQQADWKVMQMDCDVDNTEAMNELLQLFQQARPLLLYLHGYNSTPAACFERCDHLESLYGLEVVRFSWSAKKHLPNDGMHPGFDAQAGLDLEQQLGRLFGAEKSFSSRKHLALPDPVAWDMDNVNCSWWLLMALPGMRH